VPSDPTPPRRLPLWAAAGATVLVGVLTAVQARVNGSLGAALDDGLVAATISFGSGLVIVALLVALVPAGRAGARRLAAAVRSRTMPWWMLLGGLAGALTVATQGFTVATIGVALFTVGVVAGQTLGGLALDRAGYGPAGVVAVTLPRLIGGALAVLAVVLCIAGSPPTAQWWMLLLPFLAGAGISWQQATNGRLRQRVDSALTATLVNFVGGTTALVVAAAVHVASAGLPAVLPADAWLYLGGAIGVTYIFLSAALVRRTGVLLLGLGSVVGLLATSIVLDALLPAPSSPPLPAALAAVVLALVGVSVVVIPWRRRR
jgi:bacterial/archaeal transporter family-2 protein